MFFALRLIGKAWYQTHDTENLISSGKLDDAMIFDTEQDATTKAMIAALAHPEWMRKVRVQKVRSVEVFKVRCINPDEKRSNHRQYERFTFEHWVTC